MSHPPLPRSIAPRLRPARRAGLLCLLLAAAPVLRAATYHVSNRGDDAAAGTEAQPWLTLGKAAKTLAAGDTVLVAPGVYAESVSTARDGGADAPITFKAAGAGAVVRSFIVRHRYVTVDGFAITGEGLKAYQGSVTVIKGGDFATISNNDFDSSPEKVYQFFLHGLSDIRHVTILKNKFHDSKFHAISLGGSGHTIRGNEFTCPNGWDAIRLLCSDTVVAGNVFRDWSDLVGNYKSNHPDLIQAFSNNGEYALNNTVEQNLAVHCENVQIGNVSDEAGGHVGNWVWRNNVFDGVDMAMSMCVENMQFYNNTFVHCGKNAFGPIMFGVREGRGSANNATILNNIFFECGNHPELQNRGWYNIDPTLTGIVADHNLVIGAGSNKAKTNFVTGRFEAHGLNGADPLFVDAAAGDLHLRAGSPCLGQASDLSAMFKTDFYGKARVAPWDVGAVQRAAKPPAPTGLRVTHF